MNLKFIILCALIFLTSPSWATEKHFIGQWIWTEKDKKIFSESSAKFPHLLPAIWIGTITIENNLPVFKLGTSPYLKTQKKITVVLRWDDSLHPYLAQTSVDLAERQISSSLQTMLHHLEQTNLAIDQIQIDYDCPVRLLKNYAMLLKNLKAGVLAEKKIWITSLISHVQEKDYGDLFRDIVGGHILQVFDTGETGYTATTINKLSEMQAMPFFMGIASFERILSSQKRTHHSFWFSEMSSFKKNPWYQGVWIFPAGYSWTQLWQKSIS